MARLSACVVSLLALSVFASAASAAAPNVPQLVTTNPASSASAPAASLTPTIIGEAEPEDGVVEAVPFAVDPLSAPIPSTVEQGTEHPEYEIKIFEGAHCKGGTEVADGTAEALEGAGIPVSVAADSETTFSARQVDPEHPAEPSECSTSLTYWQGTVAGSPGSGSGGSENGGNGQTPGGSSTGGTSAGGGAVGPATPAGGKPRAPQIHTGPSGVARDMTPLVVGSAPGADAVTLYASENCSGTPVVKGTPAELVAGFPVAVAANTTTVFSAVAIGAQRSACSEPVAYTEDSTAPLTRVTMGPGVKTLKRSAIFRFKDVTADPPGTAFACKVDKQKWKQCASPFHLKHLTLGRHVLQIRATDLAGNVEPHPVKRSFTVVPAA